MCITNQSINANTNQCYNNISYRFYNSIRESGVPKNGIRLPQLFQQSTLVPEVASLFDYLHACDMIVMHREKYLFSRNQEDVHRFCEFVCCQFDISNIQVGPNIKPFLNYSYFNGVRESFISTELE